VAKDAFRDNADKSGLGRNSDRWSKSIPIYRDPISGRPVNSIGDGSSKEPKATPVGSGLGKPSDSTA
jgi:hypothetical protein